MVKLESGRPNFKNTLGQRPPVKSCLTSFLTQNNKVKQVYILFFHVNLWLVVGQLPNISGLAKKSLMGSKFRFQIFGTLVQNTLEERPVCHPISKGIPL